MVATRNQSKLRHNTVISSKEAGAPRSDNQSENMSPSELDTDKLVENSSEEQPAQEQEEQQPTQEQGEQQPTQEQEEQQQTQEQGEQHHEASQQAKAESEEKGAGLIGDKTSEESHQLACKGGSGVSTYLKGFGKRVIFCTLLVMLVRSTWPKIQPLVWPEAPVKEGRLYVLTDKSFRGHVRSGDHFLMMYAPWCGHCKHLKPVWDQLAKSPGVGGVKVGKVDCTAHPDTCGAYKVKGYPALLYFRSGEQVEQYEGGKSLEALQAYLKTMAASKVGAMPKKSKSKPKKKTEL